MVVRCGRPGAINASGALTASARGAAMCGDGFVEVNGHCYVEGSECGDGFTSMDVDIVDVGTVSICIPVCGDVCDETSSCGTRPIFWDFESYSCTCEFEEDIASRFDDRDGSLETRFCNCPGELVDTMTLVSEAIPEGAGRCAIPLVNCYNLGLNINVEPFICDVPTPENQTIKILVRPITGSFEVGVDAITLDDLENCNLLNGTQDLLTIAGLFDAADRPAFIAENPDFIEIEFTRPNPTEPTRILFRDDTNQDIIIPPCPRVFDPCSCRPENQTDADGIVEFWYDELTFVGNANTAVSVASNVIPAGFLDTMTLLPIAGMIGTTDGDGFLSVPFFRTPGSNTSVNLQDGMGQVVNLSSSCTLAVTACATAIPTMSEWGLIVLSLILLIFSVVAVDSIRKKVSIPEKLGS